MLFDKYFICSNCGREIQDKYWSNKESLRMLKINQFQLVDVAILIGNDYFQGVKNIGPKHAHKFLLNHKNLEKDIQEEKNAYDFSLLTRGFIDKLSLVNKNKKIFCIVSNCEQFLKSDPLDR